MLALLISVLPGLSSARAAAAAAGVCGPHCGALPGHHVHDEYGLPTHQQSQAGPGPAAAAAVRVQLHVLPAGTQVTIGQPGSSSSRCSTDIVSSHTSSGNSSSDAAADKGITYHLPPCDSYTSQCCWLKLLLPQLLPEHVDYALYLDCDMLVLQNPCHLTSQASHMFGVSAVTGTCCASGQSISA